MIRHLWDEHAVVICYAVAMFLVDLWTIMQVGL